MLLCTRQWYISSFMSVGRQARSTLYPTNVAMLQKCLHKLLPGQKPKDSSGRCHSHMRKPGKGTTNWVFESVPLLGDCGRQRTKPAHGGVSDGSGDGGHRHICRALLQRDAVRGPRNCVPEGAALSRNDHVTAFISGPAAVAASCGGTIATAASVRLAALLVRLRSSSCLSWQAASVDTFAPTFIEMAWIVALADGSPAGPA